MRKFSLKFKLLVGAGALVVGIALLAFALPSDDPFIEGKRLSFWAWRMGGKDAEKEKARPVIQRLGANYVPLFLAWLRKEDRPSLTARIDEARHSAFFWLVRHRLIPNSEITSLRGFNPSRRAMAMWTLPEMNLASKRVAAPILVRMLAERNKSGEPSDVAGAAWCALSKMAPESIGPLTAAFSTSDFQLRMLAAGALAECGPAASNSIPALETGLKDSDPRVRVGAAICIRKIGGDSESVAPAFLGALPSVASEDLDYYLSFLPDICRQNTNAAVSVLEAITRRLDSSANQIDVLARKNV